MNGNVPVWLPVCNGYVDVMFILDSSGSIDRAEFQRMLELLVDLVGRFEVDLDRTRVALMTFADNPVAVFNFGGKWYNYHGYDASKS